MKRALLLLSLVLVALLGAHSEVFPQSSTPPPMASPTPYPIPGIPGFWQNYRAVDEEFWKKMQDSLRDENWAELISKAQNQFDDVKKDSLDAAEARLFQAYGLYRLNFNFTATEVFADLTRSKVGTQVGERALSGLEEISINSLVDPDFVHGEILNDVEFGVLAANLQDFVSYYNGLFNIQKGFHKWGEAELKKINPGSHWGLKLKYIDALRDVQAKNIDAALEKFKSITENPQAAESIKNDALHQMGRLIFEKGNYEDAYKIFKQVKLNERERGFILLERAWARYYQKDYSKSLGLLTAFDAPMFDPARTPESYILKMIIYKELCHYDAALDVARDFRARFKKSLNAIHRRADLKKDPFLVSSSLMDQRYEPLVSYLNMLRDERTRFDALGWSGYSFYKGMRIRYRNKIGETEAKLSRLLEDKTRQAAEALLDWQEQMTFLDYQTRLDSLRIVRKGNEVQYQSPPIPGLTFNKIYWTFQDEFWLDELEDMKAFIESRCGEGGGD